jgi:alpha,alpha-trehalose phosphorylase
MSQPLYPVEPWVIREPKLDLDRLGQSESIFALSNGHIGLRGNLDEGDPHSMPGTYLNAYFELRPLPYAEAGYGYPESGQTLVNVTNGKVIRLLVDDEPFDLRYGQLHRHERVLDLRAGTLSRTAEWTSPAGQTVRVHSTRLVSLTHRSVAAICYDVEPLSGPIRIIVQSELVANEELPPTRADPRVAAALAAPLQSEEHIHSDSAALLVHQTRHSGLRVAAGMAHLVDAPRRIQVTTEAMPDWARTTVVCSLQAGERLRLVKFLAYGWSSRRTLPALRDQAQAGLAAARFTGWDGLLAGQLEFLDTFWSGADVVIDGDAELQQAVRFGLFHLLQAGARAEQRSIAAKGLTGAGYDGHVFWDTEMFAFPVLTYTWPAAVDDGLRWRHSILDLARERADLLGLAGAAFPWRTIRGHECSGYWPAGTAAFHIGADVADAVLRYMYATGDEAFARDVGLELLVETARLWRSLGHHDRHGVFHIDGVTGPDEYTAIADDNTYTNLMAANNLREAARLVMAMPDVARRLGVTDEEAASWHAAAVAMRVAFNAELGVHEQSEGFTRYREWDFAATPPEWYPMLLHVPYFDLYRRQVIKQADLVLAMHWRGDCFSPEQKIANFAYYEARTVRDSSLSATTQAVIAAEVGQLELAHDYLHETAQIDLLDLAANTKDGVHIAALAGIWLGLVAGFGGMRDHNGRLSFAPRLPDRIGQLRFAILWRGERLRVGVTAQEATYEVQGASPIELSHHGVQVRVLPDVPITLAIPPAPVQSPRPMQPAGREPLVARSPHPSV